MEVQNLDADNFHTLFMQILINKLYIIIIICFTFIGGSASSQNVRSGEIGGSIGGTFYLGEINKIPLANTRLAASVLYRHTFDKRFSATGSITYGSLTANDANSNSGYQKTRNKSFSSSFYELSAVGEFNFMPFAPGKRKKYLYSPYIFIGVSEMYYPNGVYKFILNIPFGIGVKYNINSNYMLGAYAGMRKTFDDFMDFNYATSTENRPEKQISYTGNDDWFSVFGISLTYKIKYREKCPAFN